MLKLQKREPVEVKVSGGEPITEGIVQRKYRRWRRVCDEELISFAKEYTAKNETNRREELRKANQGLYGVLWRRGLLDEIGLKKKKKDWIGLSDEELVRFARRFITKKKIEGREELVKANPGLYQALWKRKLMDGLGLERKQRNWVAMSDEELAEYAKGFIAERGIRGRWELEKADKRLYQALWKRKLVDGLGIEKKRRNWATMSDEELAEYAKGFIAERGVRGRKELEKADPGLYKVLRKRKLLDKVGLDKKHKDWASMGDGELIAFAKEFIAENGIQGRHKLEGAYSGLGQVLRRRKLLDEVFSDVDSSKHAETVQGVLDALESFGEDL